MISIGLGGLNVEDAIAAPGGGTFVALTRQTGLGATVAVARLRADRTLDPRGGRPATPLTPNGRSRVILTLR